LRGWTVPGFINNYGGNMFSHLKRRIGVLAAVAVMAALVPTLAVSTASAAPAVVAAAPGDEHVQVACPAGSAAAAGFTDATSTDVDCIAMFGITLGVTATTYEPSASIPRWQMALYLTRTASIAGHTLGSGADQGFTDISGYSAEIQTAINQLKQLTVTTGTTATTYSPDDNVTREQMAMFLNRLLALTTVGPGGNTDGSTTLKIVGNAGDVYNYTDIDGGAVTFEGHTAAVSLYNLGVPGHASTVTTFGPGTDMTRGEMATWLNNALDHTNARPAGLSLQFTIRATGDWGNLSPTASVSYRDSAFAPVAGQVIDMFSWANSVVAGNTQFSADGTCNLNTNVNIVGSSLTKCTIDVGDPSTNASGNIAVGALASSVASAGTTSFHAWTAAAATTYDNDIHAGLGDTSTVNQSNTAVPGAVTMSCDVNTGSRVSTSTGALAHVANVHHGDTVTITAQMTTAHVSGVATPVALPLNRLTVLHKIYTAGSDTAIASATTSAIYTDATGAATYSFTQADPNLLGTTAVTDDVIHSVLITDYADTYPELVAPAAVATGPCHSATPATVPLIFDFQDTVTDLPVKATQTSNVSSYKAAASALAPVSRTSTVTMTDKFGDAVTGGSVVFHGAGETNIAAVAAGTGVANSLTMVTVADRSVTHFPAQADVCFGATSALIEEFTAGAVYVIKTITAANPNVLTLSLGDSGGLNFAGAAAVDAVIAVAGTPTIETNLAIAHPIFGCAARTVSPAGTASIAWNDTTLTSGADIVGFSYAASRPMTTDNAQLAALGVASLLSSTNTAYRWVVPSTTAVAGGVQATALFSELDEGDDGIDHANDIQATPMEVDYVNNTMVVKFDFGIEVALGSAAGGRLIDSPLEVFTSFSWDDNDYYYLNSDEGVTVTASTMAGFEGAYVAGVAAYGLQGALATGNGLSYATGTLDSVSYQALAANTSIFKLGG